MEDFKKKNGQQKNLTNKPQEGGYSHDQKSMSSQGKDSTKNMNQGGQNGFKNAPKKDEDTKKNMSKNGFKKEESRYFSPQKETQSSIKNSKADKFRTEKCDCKNCDNCKPCK